MDRREKEQFVAEMSDALQRTAIIVVAHYSGMTVAELGALRKQTREAGAAFKVTKNRLVWRVIEGTRFAGLTPMFRGPTAIAYSADPVAAAKVVVNFAKTHPKLVVLGGGFGEQVLDAEGIKALATLPSLDELRGTLVGLIQTPATRIAGILQAPGGQLARVLAEYAKANDPGAPEPDSEAA